MTEGATDSSGRSEAPAPQSHATQLHAAQPPATPARWSRPRVAAILLAALSVTLLVHFQQFPPYPQMFLRDWGLHWTAVLTTTLFLGLLLDAVSHGSNGRLSLRLATWVPFGLLFLHEVGQFVWPNGARDLFDSLRDVALNAMGTAIAAWVLRRHLVLTIPAARVPRTPRRREP